MTPKPEEDNSGSVYDDGAPKSIYSNSEGEDCARLVKNGQLDSFSPSNTIKRLELDNLLHQDDQKHSTKTRSVVRRSKSESRGRTIERSLTTDRDARSSSRDQIRVGDRVLIKNKYTGICKYVGPIQEEKFSLPEIWFGVHLDEKLTQNSGIFGSREYFTCPFGHGVMVTIDKIKKIKASSVSFKTGPSTTSLRPSKSMSNLSNCKKRVSIGAQAMPSQMTQPQTWARRNSVQNGHPMRTLHQIKKIQATGYQQQYQSTGMNWSHPTNDLLRKSFERIVQPGQIQAGLQRNYSMPVMSNSQFDPRMTQMQRSFSLNNQLIRNQGFNYPSAAVSGSGYSSSSSLTGSGAPLFAEKNPQAVYYYQTNNAQLCSTCNSCQTCRPRALPISFDNGRNPSNLNQTNHLSRKYQNNFEQENMLRASTMQFAQRDMNYPMKNELKRHVNFDHLRSSSSSSSSGCSSGDESAPNISVQNPQMISEYEKWKNQYGLNRGRSMKRGMARLNAALAI